MDPMEELFERLESCWFFSNVLSPKQEPTSESTNPTKPTKEIPEIPQIRNPANDPEPKILARPDPIAAEVSRSPRRREEDERRRLRRMQRSHGGNRGDCRDLNLLERELKSMKDERAIKRQLKTWAVAVAVASTCAAQTTPMVALCC